MASKKKSNKIEIIKDTTVGENVLAYNFDEYKDMRSFQKKIVNQAFFDKLALELLDWAENDEMALKLSQFYIKKGIWDGDFYRFCEKSDNLKRAHIWAMQMIGNRREVLGLQKKIDPGMVSYTMAHYDKTWKDLAEWRAAISKDKEETKQTVVVIEKFPTKVSNDKEIIEAS